MKRVSIIISSLTIVLIIGLWVTEQLAADSHAKPSDTMQLPITEASVPLAFPLETYAQNALSGGPGKDGIPAIDKPQFVSADEADNFLNQNDVVFGVVSHNQAKAYPQKILVWHEIVNDRFGKENVSVTYCPLTGTAIGFRRGKTTLGVSGNLVNSNLIMYDRATDNRWPQILGTAVSGPLKGKSLTEFRVIWTTWQRWQDAYPETRVLSTDTGYFRNYRRDPYGSYNPMDGYYQEGSRTLFPTLHSDTRFDAKEVVMGTRTKDGAIAFKKEALRAQKLISGESGGMPYTAFYDPELDTAYLYKNPDQQTFIPKDGRFQYQGKQWQADAIPLEKVNTFDAMWFAWSAFYPETSVYE
jgi:hypothetical protein